MSTPTLRPHPLSLLVALDGALRAAGRDLDLPYLSGASGHAFRLTLDVLFSPGSPFELNFHEQIPLWENLGAWFKRRSIRQDDPAYIAGRAEIVQWVDQALDRGRPVIAFDLAGLPEYGLVLSAGPGGWACLTLTNREQPVWIGSDSWPPAGRTGFGRADAIVLLDISPQFDRRRADVASLRFAVEHFWAPPARDLWQHHGLKAYEFWIATLASNLPLHGPEAEMGHSFNLMLLARVRRDAADYLHTLAAAYPEAPSLVQAAANYATVAQSLEAGLTAAPFPGAGLTAPATRQAIASALRQALAAERQGVDLIERALRSLR